MLNFSKDFLFLMYFSVTDKDDNAFIYYYSRVKYTIYKRYFQKPTHTAVCARTREIHHI